MKHATITFITGTDTDVGKTVVTASLAAMLAARGESVAAYKPTQTGVLPGEPGDMEEVARLSGIDVVRAGVRLQDPMAPVPAAARENAQLPTLQGHVRAILELAQGHDNVLVEGAGGLLVEMDTLGNTIADLAAAIPAPHRTAVVLVCRSALGTLNHTLLTLEALERRSLAAAGLVIGSWPTSPSFIENSNREHFQGLTTPLLGALPAGAALLDPADFRRMAPKWLPNP
ncbi:dethiobiotin synthase [Arthrobacter sp. LAPM80]|uniref:dethiobiotin synthase n=1 Tax=Arthrobacter sp. LAPM80 TaxID=3141788 RepID=UPI00398A8033